MFQNPNQPYSNTVSIAACPSYDPDTAKAALEQALEPFGGLDWVTPGMKIAIKVNLIAARAPEIAATTHPVLVTELCRMLTARGAKVTVGDSPGGTFTAAHLQNAYRISGLTAIEETGAQLNQDFSVRDISFPEAHAIRTFSCTGWLTGADCIIDFCKLKTHAMLRMTCVVKNFFGAIPGTTKPEYHMRFPNIVDFSNMMIDLNEYFRPRICLVDAVDCMEGNGPTSGTPRHMGALLAGESPYAVDLVCADLIGLGMQDVETLRQAHLRGLAPASAADVPVTLSESRTLNDFRIPDFQTDIKRIGVNFALSDGLAGRISSGLINAALKTRPQVSPRECVSCAKCTDVCPAHAITMTTRSRKVPTKARAGRTAAGTAAGRQLPAIDRSRCIRCFCCQEFCPAGAMKVHHTTVGKLIGRISNRG